MHSVHVLDSLEMRPNMPLSAYASAPPDVTAAAPNVITDMKLVTLAADPQFRGAQGE